MLSVAFAPFPIMTSVSLNCRQPLLFLFYPLDLFDSSNVLWLLLCWVISVRKEEFILIEFISEFCVRITACPWSFADRGGFCGNI